jgi:hypothetical protein
MSWYTSFFKQSQYSRHQDWVPLKTNSYLNVPNVNLSLHGSELHIEGPQGSSNIQLTSGQIEQLKVDFEHMLGGIGSQSVVASKV